MLDVQSLVVVKVYSQLTVRKVLVPGAIGGFGLKVTLPEGGAKKKERGSMDG